MNDPTFNYRDYLSWEFSNTEHLNMPSHSVIIDCGAQNDFEISNLSLRISSIFVILVGSTGGALIPYALTKTKHAKISPWILASMKYFGSGVIIATAFIHLLAPASEALSSPCLVGHINEYSWAECIVLITIFVMFFLELLAHRYDVFGHGTQDLEAEALPSINQIKWGESVKELQLPAKHKLSKQSSAPTSSDPESASNPTDNQIVDMRGLESDLRTNITREHYTQHDVADHHFAAQLTAMLILEFGVIFHSIFIGLTLAVTADNEFNILYIVLVFHQTFEGLGLGSRLACITWPNNKSWMPWAFGAVYGLTTPVAIAIGIVIYKFFKPSSQNNLIVNGCFDAISAGILIYTGLVELMAYEFLFNVEMRHAPFKTITIAFVSMCVGAALMALLGEWV
ncbi:Zinc-regulated transporter 2 [Golovinomyces cichoracearum]|uniref:Zinc-regulated transporter 2 n=1 Tax=Golovinomyces cichoracearum TaxID=62708 RepID=A0A420HM73_9PEZI|nr:Zinc-regulated transporter 2 [Golovinomyces cichoracearum]